MSRLRNRAGIALGTLIASAIAATALWAVPITQREVPQTCQVITAEEIQKTGHGPSIAEAVQQLPVSPTNCPPPPPLRKNPLSAFNQSILDAHNVERISVGVPPLEWNDVLAQHATDYAQILARTGQLIHAPRDGRGDERENMLSAPLGYSPGRMMQLWTREKSNFVPGTFPNIARDGNWNAVLHYSQMIWPTTTYIGCGSAIGGGFVWLDCRYSPGGNKDGKQVGVPVNVANADAPRLPPPPRPQSVATELKPPQPPPAPQNIATQEKPPAPPTQPPPPPQQPAAAASNDAVPNFSTKRRVAFCGHMWIIVNTYDKQGKKTGEQSLHFSPAGYEINPTSQDFYPNGFSVAVDSTRDADQRLVDMWKYQIAHQNELVQLPVMGPWSPGNNCWTQSLWWAWYGIEPNEPVHDKKVDWPSDCTVNPAPDWTEKSRRLHIAWNKAETISEHLDVVGQYKDEVLRSLKDFCGL